MSDNCFINRILSLCITIAFVTHVSLNTLLKILFINIQYFHHNAQHIHAHIRVCSFRVGSHEALERGFIDPQSSRDLDSIGTADSFCVLDRDSAEIAATRDRHENRGAKINRERRVGERERECERVRRRVRRR